MIEKCGVVARNVPPSSGASQAESDLGILGLRVADSTMFL